MNQDGLVMVMTGAVVLSAIAMIAQAAMVFGMLKAVQALKVQVDGFLPKAEGFIATAEKTIAEHKQQISEITNRAITVLDSTQTQLVRVDGFVEETTARAKVQMDRLELVLDDTVSRVHQTVVTLNNGVLKPLREINGVASGIRAAMQHLLRGRRANGTPVPADEEMFI